MNDLNGRFQSLSEMEIIEAACPICLCVSSRFATLPTPDRGTFLKHSQFRTEPGVLVVCIGQRFLSLHDLNAVGHTDREPLPRPLASDSVKTFHSFFNLLLKFYAESSSLAANETSCGNRDACEIDAFLYRPIIRLMNLNHISQSWL
jgi:hypothetical protein